MVGGNNLVGDVDHGSLEYRRLDELSEPRGYELVVAGLGTVNGWMPLDEACYAIIEVIEPGV
jgi:hypothetical protein